MNIKEERHGLAPGSKDTAPLRRDVTIARQCCPWWQGEPVPTSAGREQRALGGSRFALTSARPTSQRFRSLPEQRHQREHSHPNQNRETF